MLIDVRSPRFGVTPAILRHAESQIETALGFARRWVLHVAVTFDDVNATRGGVDKVCRLVVHCRRGVTIVAEHRHEDLYVAISRAADMARREVLSDLRRNLTRERLDRQRPGAMLSA